MELYAIFLLFACVSAQKKQHDCEQQPEVIHTFEKLKTCKDKTFTADFHKGMMNTTCRSPGDTVVPIASDEPGTLYTPSAVVVKRCAGVCLYQLSCIPTEKIMVPFSVRSHREGETTTTCGTIYVEEHVRCKCDCKVMESHCNPDRQEYDRPACMCRCMNMAEKEECEKSDRLWDQKACKCRCMEEEDCTTGLYWVPSLCRCMKMMDEENNDIE
ncbi:hypothetical protein L798_02527 [Zootermopsis nevadensis]|uniref:Platelet-derived growth factor (PDGF) family profile domain-containing protein n=2 Tax=Zootermopsis nevadensis TaxID=136037 RepID=A0A067QJT5_ZOONE|nr:hypothetical protein L798_02527 [Zootermopsis nevadensis]